jgi:flagellar protein FlaG
VVIVDTVSTQLGQNFASINPTKEMSSSNIKAEDKLQILDKVAETRVVLEESTQVEEKLADNLDYEGQQQSLEIAVGEVESFLQAQQRNLAFSVDENTKRSVVTVKDSSSGDVIRQIPSEEVLRLAERIKDLQQDVGSSVGILLNKQV